MRKLILFFAFFFIGNVSFADGMWDESEKLKSLNISSFSIAPEDFVKFALKSPSSKTEGNPFDGGDVLVPHGNASFTASAPLSLGSTTENIWGMGIKKWPYQENAYMGVVETASYINLVLMENASDGFRPLAKTQICKDPNTYEEYSFLSFDFAKFEIKKDHVAIGLRLAKRVAYGGGGGFFNDLVLFDIQGDKLVQILRTPINCEQLMAGDWHDDGTRDHFENDEKGILVINKTIKNDYYTMTKKMRRPEDVKKYKGRKMEFFWNGSEYISQNKEIITTE
ncbi:MAG: hypothetical protein HQM08_09235 [Candidatus Riflebacteria bacterium]|nr:hypothetical protein [Candidatus Riflebacteria bacterium]